MDTRFWSKDSLYKHVDQLRSQLACYLNANTFPINSVELAVRAIPDLLIKQPPFPSNKICGILYKGHKKSSIALNPNRSEKMQNFDCMHELIHYFFHDIPDGCCICGDESGLSIDQDSYIEWQANEGAAQFLVPYQDFIPRVIGALTFSTASAPQYLIWRLSNFYRVTPRVIEIRLDTLSHELDQYRQGTPLGQIHVLSKTQQKALNIKPTPYNAMLDFAGEIPWDGVIYG